jgi:Outer membrane protein beta-barrel domain
MMFSKDVIVKSLAGVTLLAACIINGQAKAGMMSSSTSSQPWRYSLEVGVTPVSYLSKGNAYAFAAGSVATFSSLSFSTMFSTPWSVGGEVEYAMGEQVALFGELHYIRASGKSAVFTGSGISATQGFNNFEQIAPYIGARYYIDVDMAYLLPYVGAKLGFAYRNKTTSNLIVAGTTTSTTFYNSDTTISGGVQMGMDYVFTPDWAIGGKVELVASGAREPQTLISTTALPSVFVGNTGTVLQVPVMLYIKYFTV